MPPVTVTRQPAAIEETALADVRPLVLGIDAGGTMTDTLLVDEYGRFAVGKAATTPHNE